MRSNRGGEEEGEWVGKKKGKNNQIREEAVFSSRLKNKGGALNKAALH